MSFKTTWERITRFGPAIFAVGYTIGTGSVTSMIVAGSRFGTSLLWVLFLSCLFSWTLMEAFGRYYLVTGETSLFAMRKHLKWGRPVAIFIILSVSLGQWNALVGITGITSNGIYETLNLLIPGVRPNAYATVVVIAIVLLGVMYAILLTGRFSLFEKVLVFFVTVMSVCFIASNFIVPPDPAELLRGMIPRVPDVEGAGQLVVAFVGTTMAAATFLSRPLFIQGKGWTQEHTRRQSVDAVNAGLLLFIISGSIMMISMATLYKEGKTVEKVLDMVGTLEPIAGRFALVIFLLGTLSAGLSSIFPILMIAPILIADYNSGKLDIRSNTFKTITGIACVVGLAVPVFGGNPIQIQIITQIFLVFVLPLLILSIGILVNRRSLMGDRRAGWLLNLGLLAAFIFSVLICVNGVKEIVNLIT